MAESESRIVFSADATQMRKAIESQLKDLSFNIATKSFNQVRSEMEKALKNKFTVEIDIKGNSGQLKNFGRLTDQIADQFDKIGKAKDRLAANFAEKFPKMIGQVQRLSTALSEVATQFKNAGGSVPNTRQSKVNVTTTASGGISPEASREAKNLSKEIDKLTRVNTNLRSELDKSESKLKKQADRLREARNATVGFAEQTGATARRLAAYLLPAAGIFQISRGLGEAKDQLIEVNRAVIQLTQVLNGNVDQANSLANDTLKIAKSMGQSGTELLKISNFLAQSGDKFSSTSGTLQDALKGIAASNLGATFGNLEETVQGGLAYLNQFNKSGSELIDILDVANKLSKDFAVESKDLFTAVQTGGAAFAALGGDFKDFQAVVTSIRSLTRLSASSIGTGLNSVVLNVFNSDNLQFIREMGVEVNDTNGRLKSFVDIMRGVAQRFKEVNEESQANIADKLFGKRQAKLGIALLRDLGDPASLTEKALKEADKASGSLFRDAEIGLSRIDVQFQSVLTSFQEFLKDLATDRGFQTFIHDVTDGLKSVIELLKSFNNLGGALGGGGIFPSLLKLGAALTAGKLIQSTPDLIRGLRNKTGDTRNPGGLSAVTSGELENNRINRFLFNPFARRNTAATASTVAGATNSAVFGPALPPGQFTDLTNLNPRLRQESLRRQIFATQQRIGTAQSNLSEQATVNKILHDERVRRQLGQSIARDLPLVTKNILAPENVKTQITSLTANEQKKLDEFRKKFPSASKNILDQITQKGQLSLPKDFQELFPGAKLLAKQQGLKFGKIEDISNNTTSISLDPRIGNRLSNEALLQTIRSVASTSTLAKAQSLGLTKAKDIFNLLPQNKQLEVIRAETQRRGLSVSDLSKQLSPEELRRRQTLAELQVAKQEKATFASDIFQKRQNLTTLGLNQQGPVLPAAAANKIILKEINQERNKAVDLIRKEVQLTKELAEATSAANKASLSSLRTSNGGLRGALGRGFGGIRSGLGKLPLGDIASFAAPLALDLFAQNAFQGQQDLFGTDFNNDISRLPKESVQRRRSENVVNRTSSGLFGGAAAGASFGLIFGPLGAAIGAGAGGVVGAVKGYSDAIDDNRKSLELAASAAKSLTQVTQDIDSAFKDFTPKIGFTRFLSGAFTLNFNKAFDASAEDFAKELNNGTPSSEAAKQALRKFASEIVRQNGKEGFGKSLREIRDTIRSNTSNQDLAQAEIEYTTKYARELSKTLELQHATTLAVHNFNDSLRDFLTTLTKSIEELDFESSQRSSVRGARGSLVEGLRSPGGFSAGSFGSILGGAAQNRFNFLANNGLLTGQNIGQVGLGQFSGQEASQATFFSSLSSKLDAAFVDIGKVLDEFDSADQGGARTALQDIVRNFKVGTSGLASNPTEARTIKSIIDLLEDQLKPENAAKFDQKTAEDIKNKALSALNPLPKLGELLNKRLTELGNSVLGVNEGYKAQLQLLSELEDAQRGQIANRLSQADRSNALGTSTDQQLSSLNGILSQVGNTDVTGAASRLRQARGNFANLGSNIPDLISNGGNVGRFFDSLQDAAEKLTTAQNEYNNAVQNGTVATGILTKQFGLLQQKLGETIQTLSNRGRASLGDLVEGRIGLGQAGGFGVLSGLQGITSTADLAGKNPQDLANLGARFAQIPDSIADRIRKSFSLQGSTKLFSGGPSGNDALQLFDIIRGIGRSNNPQEAAGELTKSMDELNKKNEEIKRIEDAQNQALFSIALNTEQIARKILGPDFKVNIDLQRLITPLVTNSGIQTPRVPNNALDTAAQQATDALRSEQAKVYGDNKKLSSGEGTAISNLYEAMKALTREIEDAKKNKTTIDFKGDFNVFGLGEVAKDQATAAIVIKIMETFRSNLDSSDPAQAKLRDNLGQAIKQLGSK